MDREPYLTRLTVQLVEGLERVPDEVKARHIEYVRGKQRPDGGFPGREGGSDLYYTGFALRSLAVTQALTDEARASVVNFLAGLPSPLEGGFRANDRIPAADLLSTFTGGWTLDQLGAADRLDWQAVRDYADSCEHPPGGFRGGLWDDRPDVEYTFYGLGTLALAALRLD